MAIDVTEPIGTNEHAYVARLDPNSQKLIDGYRVGINNWVIDPELISNLKTVDQTGNREDQSCDYILLSNNETTGIASYSEKIWHKLPSFSDYIGNESFDDEVLEEAFLSTTKRYGW